MPQFWKVRNILFWKGRILQNSPQQLRVSSTFLHPPELIWDSPYARGLRHHPPFRGYIRLIIYNFHTHVQYCKTFHYHSCSIHKHRIVEGLKCHNFGRLGISHFEREGFCKTHPKSWDSFLHIHSPTWADLRFPPATGLRYHQPFRGHIRLTNYNFHAHVQYCITIYYHSCSIDKYRHVEGPKCHHFGRLWISHFEKAGYLSSSQLRLTTCQAELM